jgi:hypothetical protein
VGQPLPRWKVPLNEVHSSSATSSRAFAWTSYSSQASSYFPAQEVIVIACSGPGTVPAK